jgi:hypothetical protein
VSTSQRTEGSPPRQGVKAAIVVEAGAGCHGADGLGCALAVRAIDQLDDHFVGGRALRRTEHGAHAN